MLIPVVWQECMAFLFEEVGWKRVCCADDLPSICINGDMTIAVRDRGQVDRNAGRQELFGRHERDQVVEQVFVQAVAGQAKQTSNGAAVTCQRSPVIDSGRRSRGQLGNQIIHGVSTIAALSIGYPVRERIALTWINAQPDVLENNQH